VNPSSAGTPNRTIALLPWISAALVPLLIVLVSWNRCPPMLNADSAVGFYVWEAHEAGGPWNCYRDVDPANITRDMSLFLTWWSPGQYELPGLWRLLGFSWGHVMLLSTLSGCWVGAAGCWFLARGIGVGRRAAAWFMAASTLQWHTLFSFGHFRGGDVLLGAATPWMILWAWRVRSSPGLFLAGIPLLLVGGLYLKLSAVLLVFPLLLTAGLANAWALRQRLTVLGAWALAAIALVCGTWMAIKIGFLDRGANPGSGEGRGIFSPVAFAVLSPWLSATGAGSLLGHIWWWLGRDVDEIWLMGGWVVAPLALAMWWWPGRWLLRPLARPQQIAMILLLGFSIAMFSALFIRGASIGVDDRFMRPTATVLLLAFALSLEDTAPRRRQLGALALAAIAIFGTAAAAQRCISLARMNAKGREDTTQQHLTQPTLAKLAAIDARGAPNSILIYLPIPILGLEIRRQRTLITDDFTIRREHHWRGRVPELLMAMPDDMEADGRATRIRGEFADYDAAEWRGEHIAGWWFWSATTPKLAPGASGHS